MKCFIIAGAPSPDLEFIRRTVSGDSFVLCADRGYSYAKQLGIAPDVIIGDFDSCPDEIPQDGEVITLEREKLYTDTVHCIEAALQKGYDELVILAATGGRLDHTVANLCALEFAAKRGGTAVLLSEREEIRLLTEGNHRFEQTDGLTFSLFPFGCESAVVSIAGAHYPLDSFEMRSDNPIGVSNIFEGESCEITVSDGRLLMVINRDNRCL